jgi:hypothetical protein
LVGFYIYSLIKKNRRTVEVEANPKEESFVRNDYSTWNVIEMCITGGLLLVIRITIFLTATLCHYLVVKAVVMIHKRQPYSATGQACIYYSGRLFLRICIWTCGFWYIKESQKSITSIYPDYKPT